MNGIQKWAVAAAAGLLASLGSMTAVCAEKLQAEPSLEENSQEEIKAEGIQQYKEILDQYAAMFREQWPAEKIQENGMCYMFYFDCSEEKNGFYFKDLDGDGSLELLVGNLGQEGMGTVIYDLYTMVQGTPVLAGTSGERDRYYLCGDQTLWNESSGGASLSDSSCYKLEGQELIFTEGVIYDETISLENPYFFCQRQKTPENYTPIGKEEYEAFRSIHTPLEIPYTPFSEYGI